MDKSEDYISLSQFIFIVQGILVGVYVIKLPNILVPIASQDAWLCCILAVLYPLYIVLISSYVIKVHPNENILSLSRKYFGNIIGNILNFIFGLQFIMYIGTVGSDIIQPVYIYETEFLTEFKIILLIMLISVYNCYKGLNVLAKVNQLVFFITVVFLLFSMLAFKYGQIGNLKPIGGSGFINILKGCKEMGYGYSNIELILLVHPLIAIKDKGKIKKAAFIAVIIACIMYTWIVFITIVFLGVETVAKTKWTFILVSECMQIPVVNNFRTIFLFIWNMIQFKILANECYFSTFVINDIANVDRKKLCLYLLPLFLYLPILFSNRAYKDVINMIVNISVIYNIAFTTLIAILTFIKNKLNYN